MKVVILTNQTIFLESITIIIYYCKVDSTPTAQSI